jgi:hypothetical protein
MGKKISTRTRGLDWVPYRPRKGRGVVLNLSPAVARQASQWNLEWALARISLVVGEAQTDGLNRPVGSHPAQLWTLELQGDSPRGAGPAQLVCYPFPEYLDGRSRYRVLYSEGVLLFYDPESHPPQGFPQFRWVLKNEPGKYPWVMLLEDDVLLYQWWPEVQPAGGGRG